MLAAIGGSFVLVPGNRADEPADGKQPDVHRRALELVEQLGDPSFAERESASEQLIALGPSARAALLKGCSLADPEIRFRSKRILGVIEINVRERRLQAFVEDVDGKGGHDLPCWKRFSELVGTGKEARKLFVEIQRAEGELLQSVQTDPKRAGERFSQRCTALQQATRVYRQQLPIGSVAALLFVASDTNVNTNAPVGSALYVFCHQSSFRNAMRNDPQKELLRKLLAAWISGKLDKTSLYQGLMMAMQYDLKEGLTPAKKILQGNNVHLHYRQYAILAIAKLGSADEIPLLEKHLDDKTPCSTHRVKKNNKTVLYQTQVRDVALAGLLHLSGEDPKKYGFDRLQKNTQMLFITSTLGFENDKHRNGAHERWKTFRDGQRSKAGEKK